MEFLEPLLGLLPQPEEPVNGSICGLSDVEGGWWCEESYLVVEQGDGQVNVITNLILGVFLKHERVILAQRVRGMERGNE